MSKADVNAKNKKCDACPSHLLCERSLIFRVVMRILIIYFHSVKCLHCITPLLMATSTFVSFLYLWVRTSMRGTSGAMPAPLMH
jgi:hypothetical protein